VAAALELDEGAASALLVAAGHPPVAALRQMALLKEDRSALRRWSEATPVREVAGEEARGAGVGERVEGARVHASQAARHSVPSEPSSPPFRYDGVDVDSPYARLTMWVGSYSEQQAANRNRRYREMMLEKIRSFWIEGVLAYSLQGAHVEGSHGQEGTLQNAPLPLDIAYRPDLVNHPWSAIVQRMRLVDRPLPKESRMIDLYDHFGGSFLILGETGAGKTTALLDLCRDLLERARKWELFPIPVVFNLSTWEGDRAKLAEWLLEELNVRYQVPLLVAQEWIGKDELLPLLDALDEVPEAMRAGCVAAINRFREEHFVNVVVGCRTNAYAVLGSRLVLPGAIHLGR
jgi:hypothetical protein